MCSKVFLGMFLGVALSCFSGSVSSVLVNTRTFFKGSQVVLLRDFSVSLSNCFWVGGHFQLFCRAFTFRVLRAAE